MNRMKRLVASLSIMSIPLFAIADVDLLTIGGGWHSICREKYETAEFRLEYKFHQEFHRFRPLIGITATLKGAVYTYGGIGLDLVLCKRIVVSPNFAAGYYYNGGGRNLGYPIEFRSGMELAWRFRNLSRLGMHFYHISNASLGKRNPGVESLVLYYSIPVGKKYISF